MEKEGVNEIGKRSTGEVVAEMVAADKEEARKEAILRLKGFQVVGSEGWADGAATRAGGRGRP